MERNVSVRNVRARAHLCSLMIMLCSLTLSGVCIVGMSWRYKFGWGPSLEVSKSHRSQNTPEYFPGHLSLDVVLDVVGGTLARGGGGGQGGVNLLFRIKKHSLSPIKSFIAAVICASLSGEAVRRVPPDEGLTCEL